MIFSDQEKLELSETFYYFDVNSFERISKKLCNYSTKFLFKKTSFEKPATNSSKHGIRVYLAPTFWHVVNFMF